MGRTHLALKNYNIVTITHNPLSGNSYGLFGNLKNEGEYSKGRESNSITLFVSFLRKEREGFEGVWRGFNYL